MGRHLQKGFTIIEVMLVLAITSLMLSAVLNNSSRRVNEQHYREGVESFRDFLAGTFEDIDSVKNDVLGQIKRCNSSPFAGDNTVAWRGSAECFYSGREVTITYDRSSGSTKLTSRSVKAFIDPSGATEPQYIAVMDAREANLREQDIDWGVGAMHIVITDIVIMKCALFVTLKVVLKYFRFKTLLAVLGVPLKTILYSV